MNTLQHNSYKFATAVLGRDPALLAQMEQANLLLCTDDPQDLRFRDSRLCVLRWVAEERKTRQLDIAFTIRPYRLMPYLSNVTTVMAGKGYRGDALALEEEWPAWGENVGLPPRSASAQPVGETLETAPAYGCFAPWHDPVPCPYLVSESDGVIAYSSIVMQHNSWAWHDAQADFLVRFSIACLLLTGVQPILCFGNYKLSSLIWFANQWGILPVGDPHYPDTVFQQRRLLDGAIGKSASRTVLVDQLDANGMCGTTDGLANIKLKGYPMLAEWVREGFDVSGWPDAVGHYDWWKCSWADACESQWKLPNKVQQVCIERGLPAKFMDERILAERPWRYSTKGAAMAGISTETILSEVRDLFDNRAMKYVAMPNLDLADKDAPARELVEWLRSEYKGTLVEGLGEGD